MCLVVLNAAITFLGWYEEFPHSEEPAPQPGHQSGQVVDLGLRADQAEVQGPP